MQAGKEGTRAAGQRISRWANIGVLALAFLYTAVGGFDWAFNPMARLTPIGYTVAGLVPATIFATALQSMLFAERGELMGGGRERTLAFIEVIASLPYVLAGLLANVVGPFVIPLGITLASGTRWICYRSALVRHYRRHPANHQQVASVRTEASVDQ